MRIRPSQQTRNPSPPSLPKPSLRQPTPTQAKPSLLSLPKQAYLTPITMSDVSSHSCLISSISSASSTVSSDSSDQSRLVDCNDRDSVSDFNVRAVEVRGERCNHFQRTIPPTANEACAPFIRPSIHPAALMKVKTYVFLYSLPPVPPISSTLKRKLADISKPEVEQAVKALRSLTFAKTDY